MTLNIILTTTTDVNKVTLPIIGDKNVTLTI